jgi:hypothetical protein
LGSSSAKLNLYHYGSSDYSENYAIKVSGISAVWQNNTILPGPEIVEDFGQTEIPYFNTSNPNNIQLREININPEFFDQDNFENGVALRPVDGDQYAGIVFCSGDSDAFCDARYKPTLSLTYIPNNPPSKPQITFPENNKVFGGECDETIYPLTAKCTDLVEINFNSTNHIDNDPRSGAYSHSKFIIKKVNEDAIYLESENIEATPDISFNNQIENGNFTLISRSFDKKGLQTNSDEINFTVDTIPPSVPVLNDLANLTKPTANTINVNIKSNLSTDNLDAQNQIQYQVEYSQDSSFAAVVNQTDWNNSSDFNISSNLEPEKIYFFRMRAKDSKNNISDWSNTASTTIDGLPKQPILNKSNWRANRFRANTFVTNSRQNIFTGIAEKNHKVELYINNQKNAEVIVNQNCSLQNNVELCGFSINYNFSGSGNNYANGQPINSFSVQLRSVDENQNTSTLTNREIIFFDTARPGLPNANYTSNQNIIIETVILTNGNILTVNATAERYSDLEIRLFVQNNSLVSTQNVRVPFNKNISRNLNLPTDKKYRVEITSIDAAGNRSDKLVREVVRDTVGPDLTNVKGYICKDRICVDLQTEQNAEIFINGLNKGKSNQSPQTFEAIKYWAYGRIYNLQVIARDRIGNSSKIINVNLESPSLDSGGRGAPGGQTFEEGTADYNNMVAQQHSFNRAKLKYDYYLNEDKLVLRESNIPAPILKASVTYFDRRVDIFGNSLYGNQVLEIEVDNYGFTLQEAISKCHRWIYLDIFCVEQMIGDYPTVFAFKKLSECLTSFGGDIINYSFLSTWCSYINLTERPKKTHYIEKVITNDIRVNFYNLNNNQEFLNLERNESPDDRFVAKTTLDNGIRSGDKVNAKLKVNGEFNFEGKMYQIGYLYSEASQEITIDPKTDIKLINGQRAKVLDVPYFNQLLDSNGKANPPEGWFMCGAASSVMVAGYFNKIDYDKNNPNSLKENMYKNNAQGINATCSGYTLEGRKYTYGGAFGLTNYTCNQSWNGGIIKYLKNRGLWGTYLYGKPIDEKGSDATNRDGSFQTQKFKFGFQEIKNSIDNGRPIVLSVVINSYAYNGKEIINLDHILVIVGYTDDGKIIVNDTFKNIQAKNSNGRYDLEYDFSGNNATYDLNFRGGLGNNPMVIKYAIQVSI